MTDRPITERPVTERPVTPRWNDKRLTAPVTSPPDVLLDDERELRAQAVRRLQAKRALSAHVVAYALVNAFLVTIWLVSGAGFFWPIFPIFGWGIGLAFNAWDVYSPESSEDRIRAEMERLRHQ